MSQDAKIIAQRTPLGVGQALRPLVLRWGARGPGELPGAGHPRRHRQHPPYLGVGYSSMVAKSGWSFTADLGVVSRSPGNVVRLGRVFNGGQSLDEVVRDMRLAPHVQLGVSYSF